jgi:hypothetical protein
MRNLRVSGNDQTLNLAQKEFEQIGPKIVGGSGIP